MMKTTSRLAMVCLGAVGMSTACSFGTATGGETAATPPPATPAQLAPAAPGQPAAPPTSAGAVVTNSQGEQFAVTDVPSSAPAVAGAAKAPAAKRPDMTATAKQAYQAGMQAFVGGDLAGAQAKFTQATQADPNAYQAYYSLGVVNDRLGSPGTAASAYQRAFAIVPDYEPAIVAYGTLNARQGRVAEAEQFLSEKLAKFPNSAAISTGLAEVKSIGGNSSEAQRYAQQALKKNPDYRPAMVTLARDHYRNRRLDLALYTLKGILDGYGEENPPRDKNNAQARLLRGLIYKEMNRRGPAIEEFEKAIALRPDLTEARIHLANYFMEAGNATGALGHLETAVRYDNDNVVARLNLGDAYRLLGRSKEARRELEWVAKRDPSLAEPHYNLGLLYLLNDVPGVPPAQAADKAISHFENYQKMKPRGGGPDDTDELITRAKTKKSLLKAKAAEAAAVGAQ